MFTQEGGEGIRASNLHFIKCSPSRLMYHFLYKVNIVIVYIYIFSKFMLIISFLIIVKISISYLIVLNILSFELIK
jgi:hypothetical protein